MLVLSFIYVGLCVILSYTCEGFTQVMNLSAEQVESIQDNLDKLNALLDTMSGSDFIEIKDDTRIAYITVIMDYMESLENLLQPVLFGERNSG